MPMITGPGAFDPLLGKMRTKDVSGGTASGDYTFNTAEFTVGVAGLVSLNQVPASKLDTVLDIVNVTGASVTLQPNTAYKMYATAGALNVTANPPAANKWAYEGHAEIFVGSVGYVVFDTSKIVLANQLEPDSVNNCTLRFHDGMCYVSVEDHIAGYVVVNSSTSGDGSLYYGITTSTNDYVAFDASLNGTTIPLAGAVAEGEKHVVGNGHTSTTLTGAVDCGTSKFTVANLGLNNVQVVGGTMTLGDVYIPSGSTVAVSGGGLAVEKVTGTGSASVIDLGGTHVVVSSGTTASVSGCTFTNGSNALQGAILLTTSTTYMNVVSCVISGNTGGYGAAINNEYGTVNMSACTVSGNTGEQGIINIAGAGAEGYISDSVVSGNTGTYDFRLNSGTLYISGSTIGSIQALNGGAQLFGINKIDSAFGSSGTVTLTSGATLDLTGNTNATPIAPGGGITFEQGGATVYPSAGQASAYMLGGVEAFAVSSTGFRLKQTQDGAVMNGATVNVESASVYLNGSFAASNCVFNAGAIIFLNELESATFSSCTLNQSGLYQAKAYYAQGDDDSQVITLQDCTVNAQMATRGCKYVLAGRNAFGESASIWMNSLPGTVAISSGAIVDLTGNANTTPIAPGGGVIVDEGGCQVITSAGSTVSIAGGTYTQINKDGTLYIDGEPAE